MLLHLPSCLRPLLLGRENATITTKRQREDETVFTDKAVLKRGRGRWAEPILPLEPQTVSAKTEESL